MLYYVLLSIQNHDLIQWVLKKCPFCLSQHVKKNGTRRGIHRYKCTECRKQFQSERRPQLFLEQLWNAYVWGKQTLVQLAVAYRLSIPTIQKHLDAYTPARHVPLAPQTTLLIVDTTFWGRSYGVCVFRSPILKKNLWWSEVASERMATYMYGKQILESQGWMFSAVVIDGRRGLTTVFKGIPIQICIFHQIKTVTKWLTRSPETDAGKALRALTLTLSNTTEVVFTRALSEWYTKYRNFVEEKTHMHGGRWHYTHGRVRSAYRSLMRNLPYLFTYEKHPELNIPKTANSIDGSFSPLKKKVLAHTGLRNDRRFKVIQELLMNS